MRPLLPLLLLAGCSETGILENYEVPELTFSWDEPVYGAFVGDAAVVRGHATPGAVVVVEGAQVPLADDGSFSVPIPVDRPYRILEVSADLYGQHAEDRRPVFGGTDPRLSWPGGISARLTDHALDGVASLLAAAGEGILAEDALKGLIPPVDLAGTTIAIDSVTRSPVGVTLVPSEAGVTARFEVYDLTFNILASGELLFIPFEIPASLTFPTLTIESTILTTVDETGGLVLTIGDPIVEFDVPEVAISQLGFGWLSDLLLGWLDIGQLVTDLIDTTLGGLAPIPLGPPIALSTDLLGTSLEIKTNAVVSDAQGIGIVLGVGLDAPAPTTPDPVPMPSGNFADPVDLSFAVHEGLIQPLLDSDLLSVIEQDLMLPSFLGGFIGNLVKQLPGGDDAPDAYGWCLTLELGDPRVARFAEGTQPLLGVYLPDANVTFGTYEQGDSSCDDWLSASVAMELLFNVTDGTKLSFDLAVPEGKVLYYGAEYDDSDAIISQLGGTLTALLGILGGLIEIDLADILGTDALLGGAGGALGLDTTTIDLQIRGSQPMLDANQQPIDGLWEIGVQLFGE